MAEHYRFMDAVLQEDGTYDREYDAQAFTDYFKALVTTGVMKGAGNQLAVSANGSNMITRVDTGVAFILGRYYENDSFKELTHDTETIGNSRIDRIVVRMDLSTEARYVKSFIKKGVSSTNPVPPALTQTANYYEISLAQVRIVGGQTFIATDAVTDERGKDVICPWAGSNILPNFNDAALEQLIVDVEEHVNEHLIHSYTVEVTSVVDGNNVIISAVIPEITSLTPGLKLTFKIPRKAADGGYYFLDVNSLGSAYIINTAMGLLTGKEVSPSSSGNQFITVVYNGTFWVIQGNPKQIYNFINVTPWTGWIDGSNLDVRKDLISGEVRVRGILKKSSTASQLIAQLPEGYRPKLNYRVPLKIVLAPSGTYKNCDAFLSDNGVITVYIATDVSQTPNNTLCYLDFSFTAAP